MPDVVELPLSDLSKAIAEGALSSVAVTQAYLARIEAVDAKGPSLHAVIEVNPRALSIAAEREAERARGQLRGPLHGVPILVKANVATADDMQTTAGSLALVGSRPRRDATAVAKLRAAGAVILGKTNLSEWANFRGDHSVSGWSARGGQTRYPYALDRTPCGSSSGSGAAVAASLAAAALGSETDGSIVCPASMNGLAGLKPTVGLVSRAGVIPISTSQDTLGPMARNVRDAAIVLGVIAGEDERDPATLEARDHVSHAYAAHLNRGALKGARIGVLRSRFPTYRDVSARAESVMQAMRGAGAILVDVDLAPAPALEESELELFYWEMNAAMSAYLSELDDTKVRTLGDVLAFDEQERKRELFGQELMVKSSQKGPLTDAAYVALRDAVRRDARARVDEPMSRLGLDALFMPSSGPPWLIDHVAGDFYTGGDTSLAAIAGYPHVTVPAGLVSGLPVGMSFVGRAWSEQRLLDLAASLEDLLHARTPPSYAASTAFFAH